MCWGLLNMKFKTEDQMKYTYHPDRTKPPVNINWVFVFGSNLAGIHGAGAAKEAFNTYGAVWGEGVGRFGQSFGIPTKDEQIKSMSLNQIEPFVELFIQYAAKHPELKFFMTRVGCGLAGNTDAKIAPLFKNATINVIFPEQWKEYLEKGN
jgi:hypothetical protein